MTLLSPSKSRLDVSWGQSLKKLGLGAQMGLPHAGPPSSDCSMLDKLLSVSGPRSLSGGSEERLVGMGQEERGRDDEGCDG